MNGYKIEPFAIILPKTSAYVKSYGVGATKWMYFLIEDEELLKNIIVFGIKSAIVWKRNLIANLSTIKIFWQPK